jgi:hypothetical protein
MNEFNEPEVPVSAYGAARKAAWLAHHAENSAMADRAALAAHGQSEDHRVVQAGQGGLYGHLSPQDMGAAVAARPARVGDDWGGRELERNGGLYDNNVGPAPGRRDLRYVDQVQPPTVSPLLEFMQGRQQ